MMEHEEAIELLPAYLDRELGVSEALAVDRHLSACPQCQHEFAQQRDASAQLKRHATYFRASAQLSRRIKATLPRAQSRAARIQGRGLGWWSAAAVMASVLVFAGSASLYLTLPSAQDRLTEELISSHVRSLQVDHLSDVASSDWPTVKPWFNGKLDFSAPVVDLAAQGFALEGGRLDYLNGRTVAVLIYRHNRHPINLYIWPGTGKDVAPRAVERRGYHLVRWTAGGMEYWAVSDLAVEELGAFVGILRSQA